MRYSELESILKTGKLLPMGVDLLTEEDFIVFFIKEKISNINNIKDISEMLEEDKKIYIKFKIFKSNRINALLLIIKLCNKKDFIYYYWFNYCDDFDRIVINILCKQNIFNIKILNEKNTECFDLKVYNENKSVLGEYQNLCQDHFWRGEHYWTFVKAIYKNNPSIKKLLEG